MSVKVLKYQIPFTPGTVQSFSTYAGSKVIKIAIQQGIVTLWCVCDDRTRGLYIPRILILGTGWECEEYANSVDTLSSGYLDTLFFPDGTVWHVFEL